MLLTWIFGGIVAVETICLIACKIKNTELRRSVYKLDSDKTRMTDEIDNFSKIVSDRNKELVDMKRENCRISRVYRDLLSHGHKELMVIENKVPVGYDNIGSFAMVGTLPCKTNEYFIVKEFVYNSGDPEDRDFARGEALELLETVNKF